MESKTRAYKHISYSLSKEIKPCRCIQTTTTIVVNDHAQPLSPYKRKQRTRCHWLCIHIPLLLIGMYPAMTFFTHGAHYLTPATRDVITCMTIGFLCTLYAAMTADNLHTEKTYATYAGVLLTVIMPLFFCAR